MSDLKDVKFSLKVMINLQKSKVLFAEADSDFTDVLLSFLTLPLGTIDRIFKKHYGNRWFVIGSLTSLNNGLLALNRGQFWKMYATVKELNRISPLGAECANLKLNIDDYDMLTIDRDCKRKRSPTGTDESKTQDADEGDGEVFTVKKVSFVISDDLQIAPVVPGFLLQTLINLGITDTDGAELRNLTLGFNEIIDLLRGSLLSKTPLTDLVFPESGEINFITGSSLQKFEKKSSSDSNKMIVKAMVQKSKNKVLFAEAGVAFINFISSFLTIPLGGVEFILGNNTCLKNIDNLYRSIANIDGDKYLKTNSTKSMLLRPHGLTENQKSSFHTNYVSRVMFPKVHPWDCVYRQRMYLVTDDLTVTQFCMTSSFSILSRLRVPLSDIKEVELEIGFEEALSIFRASLTTTSALTNGLMDQISTRQPNQEN